MSDTSATVTYNEQTNHDMRWPRLFASSLWTVIWFGLGSFVAECIWYLWKHNLSIADLTAYSVVLSFAKALGFGVFCGVFMGFATWLSQELFGRAKPDSSKRPGT
jgi:hypothetical protein